MGRAVWLVLSLALPVACPLFGQTLPEVTIRWTGLEDLRWANAANGSPALSDEQAYRVFVRDTQGDFAVRLGTTNVRPDGPNHSRLEFTASSGLTFLGAQRLAQLQFVAPPGTVSSAVTLAPDLVEAVRLDGVVISRPKIIPGRVFVIGDQPLLDVVPKGAGAELHLYGRGGVRYQIESTEAFAPDAIWSPETTHTLNGNLEVIPFTPAPAGDGFFRSRRLP